MAGGTAGAAPWGAVQLEEGRGCDVIKQLTISIITICARYGGLDSWCCSPGSWCSWRRRGRGCDVINQLTIRIITICARYGGLDSWCCSLGSWCNWRRGRGRSLCAGLVSPIPPPASAGRQTGKGWSIYFKHESAVFSHSKTSFKPVSSACQSLGYISSLVV
jgi:hypothetical protein